MEAEDGIPVTRMRLTFKEELELTEEPVDEEEEEVTFTEEDEPVELELIVVFVFVELTPVDDEEDET